MDTATTNTALPPLPPRAHHVVRFMGLDFEPMSAERLAAHLTMLASLERRFGYVVTPNVDHMVRLDAEPDLMPLYTQAEYIVNDSRILELLAKREGKKLTASPGADVVQLLFEQHLDRGEPVNVIGATGEIIARLAARFHLADIRWHEAPMGLRHNPEALAACAEFIAKSPARFTFICVGAPQQEMVALEAVKRGDCTGIGLCCGASLDFLAGVVNRAPKWMRAMRLEWLHRLISQPKRLFRRYMVDGPRILRIWREKRHA